MTELINKFISFILDLLMYVKPEIIINQEIMQNIETYMLYGLDLFKKVNFLIPVPLIFVCLRMMIALKIALFLLWAVNWVIKRIFDVIP